MFSQGEAARRREGGKSEDRGTEKGSLTGGKIRGRERGKTMGTFGEV